MAGASQMANLFPPSLPPGQSGIDVHIKSSLQKLEANNTWPSIPQQVAILKNIDLLDVACKWLVS